MKPKEEIYCVREWLVRLEKPNTIDSGYPGDKTVVEVIVFCMEDEIETTVKMGEGFKIIGWEDYDEMQEKQIFENAKWIMDI